MLGWFKKKFGKKNKETAEEVTPKEPLAIASAPQEDTLESATEPIAETVSEAHQEPSSPTIEVPVASVEEEEQEPAPAPVQDQVEAPLNTSDSIDTEKKPHASAEEPEPSLTETVDEHIPQEDTPATEIVEPVNETIAAIQEPEATLVEETKVNTDEPIASISIDEKDLSKTTEEIEDISSQPEPEETVKVDETPTEKPEKRAQEKTKPSFFSRLSAKLAKSKEAFTYQLDTLFLGKKTIDAELLDDLEEILITADLGYAITEDVLDHARRKVKRNELSDPAALKDVLKEKLASYIEDAQEDAELVMPEEGPFIIMVVGVNGVGKTTTIGKVAHKFVQSGQSVLLIAADTFRAAAVSQLKIWGERNGVDVFSQKEGADPSSVAFDGIAEAVQKDYDVVIIDTAGRLHTQANLMEELKKIKRVVAKKHEGAPHEVMLVIDATTGQNGISQAKLFNEAVNITGITLTKLDGTAKGGIVTNISKELQTPIRFIGVGEGIEDLRDFDHREFIDALFDKDE